MNRTSLTIPIVFLLCLSLAGLARAGIILKDVTLDTDVKKVTTLGTGGNAQAESNVYSVRVVDGANVGDITVQGDVDEVMTVGDGSTAKVKSNVGSVNIGD